MVTESVTESPAHTLLKVKAARVLQEEFGFKPEEIYTEFKVGPYKVDVVGVRSDLRVAVEVGKIERNKDAKMALLRSEFNVVRRIKYTRSVNTHKLHVEAAGIRRPFKRRRINLSITDTETQAMIQEWSKRTGKSFAEVVSMALRGTLPEDQRA